MLSRRGFLIGTMSGLATAPPAMAQEDRVTRQVVQQLERQGFQIVRINRTLLGRVRVMAQRGGLVREIVLDPRNGLILRDYVSGRENDDPDAPEIGEYGDDDEYGDDYDDDDDEDDDDEDGEGDDDEDDGDDDEDGGGDDDDDDD